VTGVKITFDDFNTEFRSTARSRQRSLSSASLGPFARHATKQHCCDRPTVVRTELVCDSHSTLLSPVSIGSPREQPLLSILLPYAPAVLLLILAVAVWLLAPSVARLVSRRVDATVSIASLSRADLYSFAFVFLGLFFILSSFADVVNWIHYFTVSGEDPGHDPRVHSLYQLTRPCLTLALGLVSLLGAPRWTKKLIIRDQKTDVV
jgi:hypothetical protein